MTDRWFLDVIADMRRFAELNDLPRLAESLDDAALIAQVELAQRTVAAPSVANENVVQFRTG